MATILTTDGTEFEVDDSLYDQLNQYTWYVRGKPRAYAYTHINGATIDMHVLVAKLSGLSTTNEIDHKDRNSYNNKLDNLRECTRSQNMANTKVPPGKYSSYRGVSYYKRRGKFSAHIKVNQKKKYLGSFEDEVQAAKVYDAAAYEAFGEFATLNFPEDFE